LGIPPIIEAIRKARRTSIYVVGDPEQYIYSYANGVRNTNNIAMNKLRRKSLVRINDENHRSCNEVITFLNRFHTEVQQKPRGDEVTPGAVYFIADASLDNMVKLYRQSTSHLQTSARTITRFYLSYENKTFARHSERYGLQSLSNNRYQANQILTEASSLICAATGVSIRQACERYAITDLAYRKCALRLLRAVRSRAITCEVDLRDAIREQLGLTAVNETTCRIPEMLERMRDYFESQATTTNGILELHSSIHKAKGLDADSVLAVAERIAVLNRWLITEKSLRWTDSQDQCRIGFVAFSRARTIICIGCLEPVDSETLSHLRDLGVTIVP